MASRYQAGAPMNDLARHYGVHRNTVSTILKRHQVPRRKQGLSANQVQQAVLLYAQGKSLATIGTRFGVSTKTVHARLREQQVRFRDTNGRQR